MSAKPASVDRVVVDDASSNPDQKSLTSVSDHAIPLPLRSRVAPSRLSRVDWSARPQARGTPRVGWSEPLMVPIDLFPDHRPRWMLLPCPGYLGRHGRPWRRRLPGPQHRQRRQLAHLCPHGRHQSFTSSLIGKTSVRFALAFGTMGYAPTRRASTSTASTRPSGSSFSAPRFAVSAQAPSGVSRAPLPSATQRG